MARQAPSAAAATANERRILFNEEAERGTLGSILLDAQRVLDFCVEKQIVPETFYLRAHQTIFATMRDMAQDNRAIDVLTLAERLQTQGKLNEVGDTAYLNQLIDSTPTVAHAEYYADIVRQNHLLRRIIDCCRNSENECYTTTEDADATLAKVEQDFFDISEERHGSMPAWPESIKETMVTIERILHSEGISGIPTGFKDLDKKILGMHNGEMIVIAARPSMGKTSIAMNIAENVALGKTDHQRRPVGIFSLEMTREQMIMRLLGSHSRVPTHSIAGGFLTQATHGLLIQAADVLMKAPIYLDDTGGLEIIELRARARRMKRKYNISLFIVDYLQLLNAKERRREGRQAEIAYISGSLKNMAKELNVPVLVISQLNRAPEARDEGRPRLSDLRDSGSIEQDADVVCMLRRPSLYETDQSRAQADANIAILDVAKQRNGPIGEITLTFLDEIMRFEDYSAITPPSEEAPSFPAAEPGA